MEEKRKYSKGFLYKALTGMLEIRYFESKINELYLRGLVSGTIHLYSGQEAIAVGACLNLKKSDVVISNHRPHGHAIAKGVSMKEIMAEIMGRLEGCCGGKGGSMHIAKLDVGFLPAIAIVGAGIPIATGAAFAFKYLGEKKVVISFFGDGAINEGAFHEGLNIAAVWKLPIIFICENNLYAVSTKITSTTAIKKLSIRSKSYGIKSVTIDGNDFLKVYETIKSAVSKVREKNDPILIECLTYRHWGHSRGDPAKYRSPAELKKWLRKDPIIRLKKEMVKRKILNEKKYQNIESKIVKKIDELAEEALSGPNPKPITVLENVFT